jgi:hypothetical protein
MVGPFAVRAGMQSIGNVASTLMLVVFLWAKGTQPSPAKDLVRVHYGLAAALLLAMVVYRVRMATEV